MSLSISPMTTLIIQGSSRSTGNTLRIIRLLKDQLQADIIDLRLKNISAYDYEHLNCNDDFLPLMRRAVTYDLIILVTPVYWYSMSGLMKNFLDRITDCLKIEKETGRLLRGKSLAAISCGSDSTITPGFFEPFRLSAAYLGMQYLGELHTWIEEVEPTPQVKELVNNFVPHLKTASRPHSLTQ